MVNKKFLHIRTTRPNPVPSTDIDATFRTLLAVLSCFWFCVGNAHATQAVLLQDSYTSAAAGQTALNYNAGTNALSLLIDGRAGNIRRSWLQFDVNAGLPSGTTWNQISRATLTVYVSAMTASGGVRVERAIGAWTEVGLTNAVAPVTANDPGGIVYASARIAAAGKYVAFDVTELVRDWLDGTAPNYGLVLVPADGTVQAVIDSKEATTTSHPAILDITIGGTPSATWRSGSGAPLVSVGAVGDFYLDTAASAYYGPKSASGWGSATVLKGAQGPTGLTGATGSQGPMGLTGAQGPIGLSGTAGPQGAQGIKGDRGDLGPQGPAGVKGVDGRAWLTGQGAPSESQGALGDLYLDLSVTALYGPKSEFGWDNPVILKGTNAPPASQIRLWPIGDVSMGTFTGGTAPATNN
jgi:hypothetical protein